MNSARPRWRPPGRPSTHGFARAAPTTASSTSTPPSATRAGRRGCCRAMIREITFTRTTPATRRWGTPSTSSRSRRAREQPSPRGEMAETMKRLGIAAALLSLAVTGGVPLSGAALSGADATDGAYALSEVPGAWDGTDANRNGTATADYDFTYGDEAGFSYTLPWPFAFYGVSYKEINVDTNGNIWFTSSGSAHSFNLTSTGRGPVITAWNDDLSSHYFGGAFVQHKTNPERVVIQWQGESYREEAYFFLNDFEVVLFPDGSARVDYKLFGTETGRDGGSGFSNGTNASLSLTASFGDVYTLAGRSFLFAP